MPCGWPSASVCPTPGPWWALSLYGSRRAAWGSLLVQVMGQLALMGLEMLEYSGVWGGPQSGESSCIHQLLECPIGVSQRENLLNPLSLEPDSISP